MRYISILILALIIAFNINSQTYKNKLDSLISTYIVGQANKNFVNLAYVKAIKKYEKLNESDQLSDSLKGQLGIAYLKVSETVKSENIFAEIPTVNLSDNQLFMYSQALKYNGKYAEADRIAAKYNERNPNDSRAEELLNTLPKIEKILSEKRYLIEAVDFNSEQSDFAPFVYEDEVYFSSARDLDYIIKRKYAWKETPYLNVLKSKIKGNDFSNPKLFSVDMRSMYHDGPICISKDGNELFITRNMVHDFIGVNFKKKKDYNHLRILRFIKSPNGTWSNPIELPFNSEEYSCGHACLSPDGTRLYFTSNMPGGIGGSDIYYSERKDDEWGEPINLGKDINTEGDEMFPFIHDGGRLYFASNSKVGMGGLDVYVAEIKGNGYQVKNMGHPINTKNDDFAIYLTEDGLNGFFSSNREGGKGDDDIYRFKVLKDINFKKGLKGKLINQNTRQVISNIPVKLTAPDGTLIAQVTTDSEGMLITEVEGIESITAFVNIPDYFPYNETIAITSETVEFEMALKPRPFYGIYGTVFLLPDMSPIPEVILRMEPIGGSTTSIVSGVNGKFKTKLEPNTTYDLVFTKKNFFTKRVKYTTADKDTGYTSVNEFMQLGLEKAEIGKSIEIMILYDLGKWNIREDAAEELEDMVQFLKDNPEIRIELGSHTDARGSTESNQILSQKRAESAVNYMVERGIEEERIVAKGYGETKLKNKCIDGVRCSEDEHQANRRSEVTIIDM
jgi:outer membrane protein OmpA-like peptidoglycan-associated protein/tetratricopeptide (TPR) repeat protein